MSYHPPGPGGQLMGPGGIGGQGGNGPLDIHGNSIINESMWEAVFPLLDAHFLQVETKLSMK
jgi:hypothetical protein